MERRALLAAALSLVVFVVWQYFFPPPAPPPEGQTPTQQVSSGSTPAVDGTASTSPQPVTTPVAAAADGQASAAPSGQTNLPKEEKVIDTPLYRAVFTTEGGGIKSWELKEYTAYHPGDSVVSSVQRLLGMQKGGAATRSPMDVLQGPYQNALPFRVNGPQNDEARYQLVSSSGTELIFQRQEGSLVISKRYTLAPGQYLARLDVTIENRGVGPAAVKPALVVRGHRLPNAGTYAPIPTPAFYMADKIQHPDVESASQQTGRLSWAGVDDKYFLRAIVPPEPTDATVSTTPLSDNGFQTEVSKAATNIAAGQSQTYSYQLFFGPKQKEVLEKAGHELRSALDFGFFGPVAEVLLLGLKSLYDVLGSWGLSIILLTIIIKTLLYPLMAKQMESAQKMKEFQPEMNALREKYKDDRNRLNQEMMRFMQEKQLNPLGGCLPLLLQMPIWFALYSVLQNSIELYHTPFLYLPDLSEQDPYGISPTVLGVLMFIQQKMTPPAPGMDPVQVKMMQYMPLIFAVIMFTLPSALVVYILVNTLLTIVQQWFITRKYERAAAARVSAARR